MDLASPLRSLIPSLDSVVLEVLSGTEGTLGVSRIHRLGGRGSRAGISLVLDRLVDHGLVLAEPSNLGSVYRLNRDHVLADAVLDAFGARHEFLRRLGDACAHLEPEPVSAALFGSVARRESRPDSDIDLLIVVDDLTDTQGDAWTDQVGRLRNQVLGWTGNRLEPIVVSWTHLLELSVSSEPITRSWRDEAVTVFGTDVSNAIRLQVQRSELQRGGAIL